MWGLILSDGKPGHINQSKALCALLDIPSRVVQIHFQSTVKEGLLRARIGMGHKFPSNYAELLAHLKGVVSPGSLVEIQAAIKDSPVIVVSAGSTVATANLLIAKTLGAKSAVLMRPSAIPIDLFDLAVLPEHDHMSTDHANTVYIPVALSYFDDERRNSALIEFETRFGGDVLDKSPLALIIGGDSAYYHMQPNPMLDLVKACADFAVDLRKQVVATTSRRTPADVETILQKYSESDIGRATTKFVWGRADSFNPLPALLPAACGAIVTEDSVSMISEAILLGKRPLVVKLTAKKQSAKFARFRSVLEKSDLAVWISVQELKDILKTKTSEVFKPALFDLNSTRSKIKAILKLNGS